MVVPKNMRERLAIKNDLRNTLENMLPKYKDYTGKSIKFGILDTGISNHPDISWYAKINFTNEVSADDHDGHGTHVTGIIKATSDNMRGLCPDADIYTIKVLNDHGCGSLKAIQKGLIACLDNKVDIIIMSLGTRKYNKPIHDTIKTCYKEGIHIFTAAGNFEDGNPKTEDILFPGCLPETICIGATSKYEHVADFSAMGRRLDFVAPGVDIWSTWLNGRYATLSGTSQAVPMVAGIAGIILDKHKFEQGKTPIHSPKDLLDHLKYLAKDIGIAGKDPQSGEGIIQPQGQLWERYRLND